MSEPFRELVRRARSIRRFRQDRPLDLATLRSLVDLARLSASGGNRQPLKYILSSAPDVNAGIFACLRWAAHLKDWPGPAEGERPAAYIVVLADTAIRTDCDVDLGIAAQSILLGAAAIGIAGCMLTPADRAGIDRLLQPPPAMSIQLVIALGRPAEQAVVEELPPSGDTRYWRDAAGVHHVPKRSLDEITVAAYGP
jgi:nitroreductase